MWYNRRMGRVLALDVGDRRIGLAVSDPMKIIANPLETLFRKDLESDIEYLLGIINEKKVELIVSGLPVSLAAKETEQTVKTREFIEELKKHTDLPIRFIDERLTTSLSERVLIEGGVRRENRKQVIDKVAATVILQNYLDYYRK